MGFNPFNFVAHHNPFNGFGLFHGGPRPSFGARGHIYVGVNIGNPYYSSYCVPSYGPTHNFYQNPYYGLDETRGFF